LEILEIIQYYWKNVKKKIKTIVQYKLKKKILNINLISRIEYEDRQNKNNNKYNCKINPVFPLLKT